MQAARSVRHMQLGQNRMIRPAKLSDGWSNFGNVFDGENLRPNVSVRVQGQCIVEIADAAKGAMASDTCLSPGFIDLQVNGGGGIMLNSFPTSKAMEEIALAHRSFGTIGILPTVITDAPDVLRNAVEAALAAQNMPGILGLHIEGPHISTEKRGTHSTTHIRPFEVETLEMVTRLRSAGVTVMITLAPEEVAPGNIAALTETGAIVSLGHTNATAEQIEIAIEAGASCATHLFNAMSPMTSRAPGAVGAILDQGLPFGLICDGHHVDDRMIRLALNVSQHSGAGYLVSDAMATVGGEDHFELYGQEIRLEQGRLVNSEGALAGAHLTMSMAVERAVQSVGLSLEHALQLAITNPAKMIERPDLASLLGRPVDDLVIID